MKKLLEIVVSSKDGGSERKEQVAMAEAVEAAAASGKHLVVEAGTGTGKSIAYLVAGINAAVKRGEGPVVVATKTKLLQNQLFDDLPGIAEALTEELGRTPTYARLKGRENYLCLNRANNVKTKFADAGNDVVIDTHTQTLLEAAEREGWSGERDDLTSSVSKEAWKNFSVSSSDCIGAKRCVFAQKCLSELARARAAQVDIVVVNHKSLAIELLNNYSVPVVPAHILRIIDEAHEIAEVFTETLTVSLSEYSLLSTWRLTQSLDEGGSLSGSSRFNNFKVAVENLFGQLRGMESNASRKVDIAAELVALRPGHTPKLEDKRRVDILPAGLEVLMSALGEAAKAAAEVAKNSKSGDPLDRTKAVSGLTKVKSTVDRFMENFGEDSLPDRVDVVWIEHRRNKDGTYAVLGIEPLSVSEVLRDRLFGTATTVLTSATLQTNGSFKAMARDWGLSGAPPETFVDVGTPFDYRSDGVLYLAGHLRVPGGVNLDASDSIVLEEMAPRLDEMEALIRASGGRALVLFTSIRAAELAAGVMGGRLDTTVLCQFQDDKSIQEVIDDFKREPTSSLFGTASLRQGLDVPRLPLVIIERLPFAPTSPLLQARERAAKADPLRVNSWFNEIALDPAAVKLHQSSGRALRREGDQGVVAILDSRIVVRYHYGNYLVNSLPPFRRCEDGGAVREALRNLAAGSSDPFSHIPRPPRVDPAPTDQIFRG